jgi:hypothetical protein
MELGNYVEVTIWNEAVVFSLWVLNRNSLVENGEGNRPSL